MRAHIFRNSIIPAVIAFAIIGFTATEAAAQRRDNNPDQRRNEQRVNKDNRSNKKDFQKDSQKSYRDKDDYKGKKNDINRHKNHEYADNHKNGRFDNGKHNGKKYDDHYKRPKDNYYHKDWNNRHYREHHPISFRKLPRKAVWVHLNGEGYFLYKGKFFMASPFGYYRVDPPKYLRILPDGCHRVWVNGNPMFKYHDIFFIETPLGFKIMI